ncbi:MAG TPA: hypothetical protein VFX48_01050 [Saprospiraceae bacterium]|nr:hypothetical protein [Saprospiraceae bacterium]
MKKVFLSAYLTLISVISFHTLQGQENQYVAGIQAGSSNDPATSAYLNADLIKTFFQVQFPYASGLLLSGCEREECNAITGICTVTVPNPDMTLEKAEAEAFNEAVKLFEDWNFEAAHKLFYRISEAHPGNDLARYYLALTQLYRGFPCKAITNLSLINKRISLAQPGRRSEFLDDVRFYFALSSLLVQRERRMARSLFGQLNYEGGKYQAISTGMIELL